VAPVLEIIRTRNAGQAASMGGEHLAPVLAMQATMEPTLTVNGRGLVAPSVFVQARWWWLRLARRYPARLERLGWRCVGRFGREDCRWVRLVLMRW
jgi:hypothetical protein